MNKAPTLVKSQILQPFESLKGREGFRMQRGHPLVETTRLLKSKYVRRVIADSVGENGLWRNHSWGLTEQGIIETTVSRIGYFGVRLEGEGADLFTAK
ncbi:MAG: hypothetical protein QOH31_4420 [Verrucomicrobiota bacterium]|jgi:hypothetical protein